MSRRTIVVRCILASVLAVAGFLPCAHAEPDGPIGKTSSPLVAGTLVSAADREALGLLSMNGSCSASLLNNNWAVSASHCLSADNVRRPNTVSFTADWATVQLNSPDYIYRFWGSDQQGNTWDISLLHVANPFRVNGSTSGYQRELSTLSLNDMNGRDVTAYGRGINVLASNASGRPVPSSGDGLFRSGNFRVNRIEATLFWYPKNAAGQIIAGGDSGGPSFEFSSGSARIAGVHALCHNTCLAGQSCPSSNAWMWTADLSECADAPVGYLGGTILDIIRQSWNPANPVQLLSIPHSEAGVSKTMLLGSLDTLPWDYVRRAAQQICVNRGFIGGYADGRHVPGQRYQIACMNDTAARYYDAIPAQLAQSGNAFRDITQVGWAQAARAALGVCKFIDPTSVGGVFNGYQWLSPPSSPFLDQRDGVLCFNQSSATFIDATLADLNATGSAVGDLNAMSWAVAGRAAAEYCRRKFYPAGGFFSGHQLGDKRGVFCVGKNSVMSDRLTLESNGAASYRSKTPGVSQTAHLDEPLRAGGVSGAAGSATMASRAGPLGAARVSGVASQRASALQGASAGTPPVVGPAPLATMFYAIGATGTLTEYRHVQPETGAQPARLATSSSAWNEYVDALPAGGNHFYARARNGDLLWYQHDGFNDGADTWRGPIKVGNGWQTFAHIFGGGDGVIYAIAADGALVWYRHLGYQTGEANAWQGPQKVGSGWSFKHVFSAGAGAIYAITQDGKLLLYRHLDYLTGGTRWSGPTQVGTGWHGFAQVFSTGEGVIYGLNTDGKLLYYRHLTWNAPQPTMKWVGAVPVGEGFSASEPIFPLLPASAGAVH
jgi:hypothetical protein